MEWKPYKINEWEDFIKTLEDFRLHLAPPNAWIFRGQANTDWPLAPSITRPFIGKGINRYLAYEYENMVLHNFLTSYHLFHTGPLLDMTLEKLVECHLDDNKTVQAQELIECWALMQHHNCPTRLLDWTTSPYVALYFAVEQERDRDGAVWAMIAENLVRYMEFEHERFYDLTTEHLESGPEDYINMALAGRSSQRLQAQQGLFAFSTNILACHDEIIESIDSKYIQDVLPAKIIIPADKKEEFLTRLWRMNITASALFPGLDGMGRAAAESIKIRLWREAQQKS
jgi:hypothetical protein